MTDAFDTIGVMDYTGTMAKVTIQNIAEELGLSRNTVSKAMNNTGILAEATRQRILKKASEMGYKTFFSPEPEEKQAAGELVLFTAAALNASHFSTKMLDEMQQEASTLGYGFTIYRVMPQELEEGRLPANFDVKRAVGIFCVEMFDVQYSRMICSLGVPAVFIDTAVYMDDAPLPADVLLMENKNGIYSFVKEMAARGKAGIGFAGESLHCLSFYERYDACMGALRFFGLELRPEWLFDSRSRGLAYPEHEVYLGFLESRLRGCKTLPSVIICANDFVAMDMLHVFRNLGIRVPDDVLLCGFDDSPESRIITPALTTVRIHSRDMGREAINLLFSRIKTPSQKFRTVYVQTELVYRASTGD